MLKRHAVEGLGIVDGSEDSYRTVVFKALTDALLYSYQHMGGAAALDASVLVVLELDFLHGPVQDIGLIYLGRQKCARYITEPRAIPRTGGLGNHRHMLHLPGQRPDASGRDGVVDVLEGDGEEIGEFCHECWKDVTRDH